MAGGLKKTTDRFPGSLFVLSSPEELARAAAGRLWGIARERAAVLARTGKGTQNIYVALSGGETPRLTLSVLSSKPYRDRFPWHLVHFYQVDERWVPGDAPLSNQRMLRESLVSRAPVPADHFHAVDTSLPDPGEGARRYEDALRHAFPRPPGGFPRFDAILLGLGTDGHTASLFPGSSALEEESSWVTVAEGGTPPVSRVSLTLPVLNASAQVLFLVSGGEKAGVLEEIVSGKGRGLPASRVSPRRGRVVFLADVSAASRLGAGAAPVGGTGGRQEKRDRSR